METPTIGNSLYPFKWYRPDGAVSLPCLVPTVVRSERYISLFASRGTRLSWPSANDLFFLPMTIGSLTKNIVTWSACTLYGLGHAVRQDTYSIQFGNVDADDETYIFTAVILLEYNTQGLGQILYLPSK